MSVDFIEETDFERARGHIVSGQMALMGLARFGGSAVSLGSLAVAAALLTGCTTHKNRVPTVDPSHDYRG
jgi:hypothetical protein